MSSEKCNRCSLTRTHLLAWMHREPYPAGVFSKEELEASAVDRERCVVLDGLNDLDAVLRAFQLSP